MLPQSRTLRLKIKQVYGVSQCLQQQTVQYPCRVDHYGRKPRSNAYAELCLRAGHQQAATSAKVQAVAPTGKQAGLHTGSVAVRATGKFRVGKTDGIAHRRCRLIQRVDGYDYTNETPDLASPIPPPA